MLVQCRIHCSANIVLIVTLNSKLLNIMNQEIKQIIQKSRLASAWYIHTLLLADRAGAGEELGRWRSRGGSRMAEEQGWMVAEEQGRSSDGGGEWVDGGGGAGEDGGGGAVVDAGGELGFRDGGGGAGVDGGGGAAVDGGGELGFRDGGGIGASAGRRRGGGRRGGGEVDGG